MTGSQKDRRGLVLDAKRAIAELGAVSFSEIAEIVDRIGSGSNYLVISGYDREFIPSADYRSSLPDLQNEPADLEELMALAQVGISDFRIPIRVGTKDGLNSVTEGVFEMSVGLEGGQRGINMSRLIRSLQSVGAPENEAVAVSFEFLERLAQSMRRDHVCEFVKIEVRFRFAVPQMSLRSSHSGYQSYAASLSLQYDGSDTKLLAELQFVYSSTCPCSLALAEHARFSRGRIATPHAQRSVADVTVEPIDPRQFSFTELLGHCRSALPTETQVVVRREDEQAFAELNAVNPVFVEDAVRKLLKELGRRGRFAAAKVRCKHMESLHSHDVFAEGSCSYAVNGSAS